MKLKFLASIALAACTLVACDDTTEGIGTSLTDNADKLSVSTATFTASTKSVVAESVISRNLYGYLGKIKDPETNSYLTGNYMTQFHSRSTFSMPEKSKVGTEDGKVIADSVKLVVFYNVEYGDSLAPMQLTAMELSKAVADNTDYYADFDPEKEGYIREGGIKVSQAYTLKDMTAASPSLSDSVIIRLDKPYTDKNGVTYNNYGTYVIRQYYADPSNFTSAYKFTKNIVPGFYFKSTGGLGNMARVFNTQLNIYYHYKEALSSSKDTTYVGLASFVSTDEVMLTNNFINDKTALQTLVNDNSCTYLKTPAGIFTEVELPVDEIMKGHENDTLNSVKIEFNRLNDTYQGEYPIKAPTTLLMIPADSLESFFANHSLPDYKKSFIATASNNTYTFNNIEGLVKAMHNAKALSAKTGTLSANWNKAVIIPVEYSTVSVQGYSYPTNLCHYMGISSARLKGGKDAVKLSVIYSKFANKEN